MLTNSICYYYVFSTSNTYSSDSKNKVSGKGVASGSGATNSESKEESDGDNKNNRSSSISASASSGNIAEAYAEDRLADQEFEQLKLKPLQGTSGVSNSAIARTIVGGIRINNMIMRDANTGIVIWESKKWGSEMFVKEMKEYVPKAILSCKAISREINFTSSEQLDKFRIEQRVYFNGQCIEEWFFSFGFCIPGSTNSWQQVIQAANPDKMIPAELLSGNVTFETSFYDDDLFLCKNLVRIFYV